MSGGTASSVQSPNITQFSPQMAYQSAYNAQGLNAGLPQYNLYGSYLPLAQETFANQYNNPFAGLAQAGAGTAGKMAKQQALGQMQAGNELTNLGLGVLPGYGAQVMQTAFDPQKQLYNYLQNQNMQQTDANLAAAGLATTPYGAGVADQSNQQFNMNWQNQQLQRQLAGLQGEAGALGTGANIAGLGQQLGAAAPGQYFAGANLPYQTYGSMTGNQMQALSGLGGYGQQAAQIPQQMFGNDLGLIQAAMSGDQNALNLMQLQLGQNQANWNQLGGLGSGIGGLFGGMGPFGALGAFRNIGNLFGPQTSYGGLY